jgi:membrane protein implicated in regulation of membrane protease activity
MMLCIDFEGSNTMIDADLIPWIFGAVMTAGVVFLLFSIFFGDMADLDTDADAIADGFSADPAETRNLGCTVIAAFCAGFGGMGLLGSLAGWDIIFSLLAAVAFGLIFGRTTVAVLNFVVRQQSSDLLTGQSLVGGFARVTVDTPAGQTGEALVEGDTLIKYPVRAVSDDVELKKGDYVEIIEVQGGRLYVKKKRQES